MSVGVIAAHALASPVLADTPIFYGILGEASGATVLTDSSGYGRHGNWQGSPILGVPGLLANDTNTCFQPNGSTSNKGQLPSATWMDVPTITLEAWVRFTSSLNSQMIMERDNQSFVPRPFQFRVNSSKVNFIINGGGVILSSTSNLSLNTTYHLVCTYDQLNAKIYINGNLDATSGSYTTAMAAAVRDIYIGSGGSLWPMTGKVGHVAIYSGALSSTRIAAHYAAGI